MRWRTTRRRPRASGWATWWSRGGLSPGTTADWRRPVAEPASRRPGRWHRACGSGGPLVGADGERREDDEDPDQPRGALPEAFPDRAAERERPHRVDHVGDRLVVGERLQPAGHGVDRHERRAEEHEWGQPDQPERLYRLLIPDGQPGERGDAAD